jgi:hypothetical protein
VEDAEGHGDMREGAAKRLIADASG